MEWAEFWRLVIQVIIGAVILGVIGFVGTAVWQAIKESMQERDQR